MSAAGDRIGEFSQSENDYPLKHQTGISDRTKVNRHTKPGPGHRIGRNDGIDRGESATGGISTTELRCFVIISDARYI